MRAYDRDPILASSPTPAPSALLQRRHAMNSGAHDAPSAVPPLAQNTLHGAGKPLDPATRALLEPRFGQDFSSVRVHTDAPAAESARAIGALAYTVGPHVVFAPGQFAPGTPSGQHLLAHELAHTIQQRGANLASIQTLNGGSMLEAEADQAAQTAVSARGVVPTLQATGMRMQAKGVSSPELMFEMIMSTGSAMTAAMAQDALTQFQKMSAVARKKAFDRHYSSGGIARLLSMIPPDAADGPHVKEVALLLRLVEEAETRAASKLSDDQMAEKQSKVMKGEAVNKAQADLAAKLPSGSKAPAPTATQIDKAHQELVGETSISQKINNRWRKMTPAQKTAKTKEGKEAIDKVVALAKKSHPELKLTVASFKLDFDGVEERGQGILAMGGEDSKGRPIAVVGLDFVTAAQVDPAYALSTIVHEIFGHPTYDTAGSYHLDLYDKASAKAGFFKKPAGSKARQSEDDAFGYQETEIYSLMRELPYWTPVSAADEKKHPGLTDTNPDPKDLIADHIDLLKQQWGGASLAIPLLHGLYVRLRLDPRISKMARDAFEAGLKKNGFTAAEIKQITQ